MARRSPHFYTQSKPATRTASPAGKETQAKAWFEQGLALHQQGDLALAASLYEQVLLQQPKHADALHLLGVIKAQQGQSQQGIALMTQALELQPNYPSAWNNLGNEWQKRADHERAVSCYDQALRHQRHYVQAWANKGASYLAMEDIDSALACLDQALQLDPQFVFALNTRGNVLKRCGRRQEALQSFETALKINPQYSEAWSNRGVVLRELHQLPQALESLQRALQLNPLLAQAHSNKAHVEQDLGEFEQALASCDAAIAIAPQLVQAHNNRGLSWQMLHHLDEAVQSYEQALALDAQNVNAQFNRALAWLCAGDYEKGWAAYEWRWKKVVDAGASQHQHIQPWRGQVAIKDKRILLFSEQGLGDTLQFCRWVSAVKAQGAYVVLQVPKALVKVLRCLSGVDEWITTGEAIPEVDYACSLMSLPLALRVTQPSQCAMPPYLHADQERSARWHERLAGDARLKVGFVCQGGFRSNQPELWAVNERRNIDLTLFSQALHDIDVVFVSLQKGDPAEALVREHGHDGWPNGNLCNLTSELHDFEDTAALIESLDLVISVDTSTAHLAGAMGKAVWLLNRYDSCWRWQLHGEHTHWYDSLRVYRQDETRRWEPVLKRVADDLSSLVAMTQGA